MVRTKLILVMCVMYNGDGDSNDDVEVEEVGGVNTNGGDNVDFGNDDSKPECDDDRGSGDSEDKDDGSVDHDGDADFNICNDANCGGGRVKVDCSKDTAVDDSNCKSDGHGDTNDDGKGGDDSDGGRNLCFWWKMYDQASIIMVMMSMNAWILIKIALKLTNSFRIFAITNLR